MVKKTGNTEREDNTTLESEVGSSQTTTEELGRVESTFREDGTEDGPLLLANEITHRDDGSGPAPQPASGSGWLPSALIDRFHITHEFDALGAEADAYLVEDSAGEVFFAKIYRRGIAPKADLLEIIKNGDKAHVIDIVEYGQSDGRWYELLEYVQSGSLRDLIDAEGPVVDANTVFEIVKELGTALAFIHGGDANIEHRDLKPANILVRTRSPLDLVLTDFGIASILSESVHYTTANRTLRYAPPEAVSGSVYRTAWDHWSLGMIIVELLTGRHPFHELGDQVIQARLSTQPVDELVEGVDQESWRRLCRGLLRRDPKKRWGSDEIDRWLANPADTTIMVADEDAPQEEAQRIRPFPFQRESYQSIEALAHAMASNWEGARSDWKSGRLMRWVEADLRDYELERTLEEIDQLPNCSIDNQMFRVIHAFDPAAPMSFMGLELTEEKLAELANNAAGNPRAKETLLALYQQHILSAADQVSRETRFADIAGEWDASVASYQSIRSKLPSTVVTRQVPELDADITAILLAGVTPGNSVEEALRARAVKASTSDARECQWYAALGNPGSARTSALVIMPMVANEAAEQTRQNRRIVRKERERKRAEDQKK